MSPFPTLNEPTFTECRNSTGSLKKVIWVSKVSHIKARSMVLRERTPVRGPEAWLSGSVLGSSPPVHWSRLCIVFTFALQDFDFILSHLLTWTPMLLDFSLSFWSNNLKLQTSCQVLLCGFDLITQNFNILYVTSF